MLKNKIGGLVDEAVKKYFENDETKKPETVEPVKTPEPVEPVKTTDPIQPVKTVDDETNNKIKQLSDELAKIKDDVHNVILGKVHDYNPTNITAVMDASKKRRKGK